MKKLQLICGLDQLLLLNTIRARSDPLCYPFILACYKPNILLMKIKLC